MSLPKDIPYRDEFGDHQQADQQGPDHDPTGRTPLGVREGDELAYSIEDERIVITKAPPKLPLKGNPLEDPFATFWEWDTEEDERTFANL